MYDYTKKKTQNQLLRNEQGKVIGKIIQDSLVKKVKGSKHMLRTPKGWACDEKAIDISERSGVKYIEITDIETNILYTTTIENFRKYGILINRGYGGQIVIPLAYWITINADVLQSSLFNWRLIK